jgi:hypothetical protein
MILQVYNNETLSVIDPDEVNTFLKARLVAFLIEVYVKKI